MPKAMPETSQAPAEQPAAPDPTGGPIEAARRSPDEWALRLYPDPGKPGAVRVPERFLLAGMKMHFHLVEGDTLTEADFTAKFAEFGKQPVGR